MADIALVPLEGADQLLVAARDPPLRPLVVSGQPAQDPLLPLVRGGPQSSPSPYPLWPSVK